MTAKKTAYWMDWGIPKWTSTDLLALTIERKQPSVDARGR